MVADVRLQSFALTQWPTSDVLCAYAAGQIQQAADELGRWVCIGSFSLPVDVRGRLWVVGWRSTGVTAQVKLFGPEAVPDAVAQLSQGYDATALSAKSFVLSADTVYQVGLLVAGTAGDANYAVVRTVSLAPPG